ncbi:hypothetical protein JTB14_007788 [Gonioctena quinquepunctata]|nr:hypothetical protein JTB14_007788 [Gonioctena quinquepunctata]
MWRDLPEEEKNEFVEEYDIEKVEYEKTLKNYHNSPAYQAFLAARTKGKSVTQGTDGETHERQTSSSKQQAAADRRIEIQPAEDEDDQDDGYSVKHIAYARYLRNHRLVNEIFSENVVPDVRSVVTRNRMEVLKRQVQSLTMHQKKLEAELQQIEEKFEAKKRKFVESSDQFQEELKKHCKPAVDDDTFQKMVEKQYEVLKKERNKGQEETKPKVEEIEMENPAVPQESNQAQQEPMEQDPPQKVENESLQSPPPPQQPTTNGQDAKPHPTAESHPNPSHFQPHPDHHPTPHLNEPPPHNGTNTPLITTLLRPSIRGNFLIPRGLGYRPVCLQWLDKATGLSPVTSTSSNIRLKHQMPNQSLYQPDLRTRATARTHPNKATPLTLKDTQRPHRDSTHPHTVITTTSTRSIHLTAALEDILTPLRRKDHRWRPTVPQCPLQIYGSPSSMETDRGMMPEDGLGGDDGKIDHKREVKEEKMN